MGEFLEHRYLVALGSNMRHGRHGDPRKVVAAALEAIAGEGHRVEAISPLIESAPLGPSKRRYANAVAIVYSSAPPRAMLTGMKAIEDAFGRRSWRRWGARVIDIDLVLWGGGTYRSAELSIPHPLFRERTFVLGPATRIAADWRDSDTGLTVRQLHRRLTRPGAVPR